MEIGFSTYTSFELRLSLRIVQSEASDISPLTQSRRSSTCIFASGSTSFTKPVECTHARHQCVWHPERTTCAVFTAGCEQVKNERTVDSIESRAEITGTIPLAKNPSSDLRTRKVCTYQDAPTRGTPPSTSSLHFWSAKVSTGVTDAQECSKFPLPSFSVFFLFVLSLSRVRARNPRPCWT